MSTSLVVAEQLNLVEVVTPVLGLIVTESTTGSVFSTETNALSVVVPVSASVAVTTQ